MTRVNGLSTKKAAGRTALFHGKVILQFVNNDVMSMAQGALIVFEENSARCALGPNACARVGAKGQVRRGASLALSDSVGAGVEDATVRDVNHLSSPVLMGRGTTVRARAKVEERGNVHQGKAPMVARLTRAEEQRKSGVLATFDTSFSFAVAGRVTATSAFHPQCWEATVTRN